MNCCQSPQLLCRLLRTLCNMNPFSLWWNVLYWGFVLLIWDSCASELVGPRQNPTDLTVCLLCQPFYIRSDCIISKTNLCSLNCILRYSRYSLFFIVSIYVVLSPPVQPHSAQVCWDSKHNSWWLTAGSYWWLCTVHIFGNDYNKSKSDSGGN
jgi:hypothetical protein